MQDAPSVIPAKAGIQKREQFFVTLHNTSWVRDYGSRPPILHARRPHPVTLAGRKVAVAARIQVTSEMARFSAILNPET